MAKQRKIERITFRLTEDLRKHLERAARKENKDIGEFIRECLLKHLLGLKENQWKASANVVAEEEEYETE